MSSAGTYTATCTNTNCTVSSSGSINVSGGGTGGSICGTNCTPSGDFDWTQDVGYTMYYRTQFQVTTGIASAINVKLPFFKDGPLSEATTPDQIDFCPCDGWMLAYKNFGTNSDAPDLPYFALYNKYRGKLRIMVYNARETSSSTFSMTLGFRGGSPVSPLFTMVEKEISSYSDRFNPENKQIVIGRVNEFGSWFFADFDIAGYDPNLDNNTVLRVELKKIDESKLTLNSTKFTLDEILKNSSEASNATPLEIASKTFQEFATATEKGVKVYKDIVAVRKAFVDISLNANWALAWARNVLVDAGLSTGSAIPYIGAALGVIDYFLGGSVKAAPREPMKFKGVLNFDGKIESNKDLASFSIALSQSAPITSAYDRPVQNIPWGIFNIGTIYVGNDFFNYYTVYGLSDFPQNTLKFNPSLGITVNSVKISDIDLDNSVPPSNTRNFYTGIGSLGLMPFEDQYYKLLRFGLEIKYTLPGMVKNSDNQITIYKVYQPFRRPSPFRLSSNNDTPVEFSNYPNPFVKSTILEFYLTDETEATIECFDSDGRLVKTLSKNSYFASGNHKIEWDGTNDSGIPINQGVYISRITLNGGKILSRKIIKE